MNFAKLFRITFLQTVTTTAFLYIDHYYALRRKVFDLEIRWGPPSVNIQQCQGHCDALRNVVPFVQFNPIQDRPFWATHGWERGGGQKDHPP